MVDFVREVTFTGRASPVQEGASKPFSEITFENVSATVKTIAHWTAASKEVLEDLPQMQAYIGGRLIDGLLNAEDSELMFGDGTGFHLSGFDTLATAYAGTWAVAGDTLIDKLGHALQELEQANYIADGIVLNPLDWRKILMTKTEEGGANKGEYLMGGPGSQAAPRLWDIPVAVSTAQRVGRFLVGQFLGSAMIFDRMESRVAISTEHADYFVQNRVAILAEERIALVVSRPHAFRTGNF